MPVEVGNCLHRVFSIMDKIRILREMAALEFFLKDAKVDYYMIVGHYRRWLASATPDEEPFVYKRIMDLYTGDDNINTLIITEPQTSQPDAYLASANRQLDRMRESFMEALNSTNETYVPPKPVYAPEAIEPEQKSVSITLLTLMREKPFDVVALLSGMGAVGAIIHYIATSLF